MWGPCLGFPDDVAHILAAELSLGVGLKFPTRHSLDLEDAIRQIKRTRREHVRHRRLRIAAVQLEPLNPFRRPIIFAVIASSQTIVGAVLGLGEGNAATRFIQRPRTGAMP